ncbi:hypothetical protein CAEBREN_31673 [Caenorhabditis brenneri]|uniref:Peptidase M13 C-terminal domain-containing protein n=1 Tax=Caenorhabditis brenneri TaxID=135651 RepID=G0MHX0_CAEBE|nr:hypothetical protein CAEBREN_31673 [Caenorhabditis brenneri]
MRLLYIHSIVLLIILSCAQLSPADPTACNNFYEYVCDKNLPKILPRVRDVRWLELSDDIDQYQDYIYHHQRKQRLWEAINPDIVSKWLVQFDTYWNGVKWNEHQKRHEEFLNIDPQKKREFLESYIVPYKFMVFTQFYKSLKQSVEYLAELKVPVSTHNHFYHGVFDEIRDIHISDIRTNSRYNEEQRDYLIEKVKSLKVIFPFLEVNPAMEIFEKYITAHTSRFIFQHVAAASSMLSFNYQNEIHIAVFTMFNPVADPSAVYNQFLYVLCHELQHAHYNVDPSPFEPSTWESEKQCIVDRLDFYANAYKENSTDWTGAPFSYEDSANVAGLRLMMLYTAQKTSNYQEIRDSLEKSVGRFCTKKRENPHHNPHDVSINVAVSQMPTFNFLYNCTLGDRMYVPQEKYCRTLNMDIDVNEYHTQKIEKEDLFVLAQFMDVLENTADELDAANITTFEGQLFDITVEDVEEKEEELEGSAESSESSESEESSEERDLEEAAKDLDDSEKEAQQAENSSYYRFSITTASVNFGFFTLFFLV